MPGISLGGLQPFLQRSAIGFDFSELQLLVLQLLFQLQQFGIHFRIWPAPFNWTFLTFLTFLALWKLPIC